MRKSKKSLSKITEERATIEVNYTEHDQTRIAKHQKLIERIHLYTRSLEEEEKLQRMKKNTEKEIDMRFKAAKPNQQYSFPLNSESKQEQFIQDQNLLDLQNLPRRKLFYDLYKQNQIKKYPSQSQFVQMNRRIKSLEHVVNGVRSEKLIKKVQRLQTDLGTQPILFTLSSNQNERLKSPISKLKRSVTVSKEIKNPSGIVLPSLPNLSKKGQNLKTESSQKVQQKNKLDKIILKKLTTQVSDLQGPIQFKSKKIYKNI